MWILQKRQCEIEKTRVGYWAKLSRNTQNYYSSQVMKIMEVQ